MRSSTLYVEPRRVYCLSKDFFWKMNCHDFSCHKNQHYHSPPNSPLCTTAQKMHHQTKHSRLVEYEQIWFMYGHWFICLFFCHCQELRYFYLATSSTMPIPQNRLQSRGDLCLHYAPSNWNKAKKVCKRFAPFFGLSCGIQGIVSKPWMKHLLMASHFKETRRGRRRRRRSYFGAVKQNNT